MIRPPMRALALLTLLAALGLPRPATAQDDAAARFRLAESYLRAGQTERAIAFLEDLHAADPGSFPVYDALKNAYVAAGEPDRARRLVEGRIEAFGRTANLLAELGGLHFAAGDAEAAEAAWAEAVATAPDDPTSYRLVYAVQARERLFERARDVLLRGRERLGQPDLYRVELAELYGRTEGYGEALAEYAGLLKQDPQRLSFVQSRIGRLLDQDGAPAGLVMAMERLIRDEPLEMTHRSLAAWLYAETGDFGAALDATRAIDRLNGEQGQSLFAFAESALAAGAYAVARQAYEIVLDRHAAGPIAPLALLSTALLHEFEAERAGERAFDAAGERVPALHYDAALDRYRAFLEAYPRHPRYPVALRQLARLQKDVFRDYAEAERLLREVVTRFPAGPVAARAQLDLGEVALLRGDLAAARAAFAQVEEGERIGEAAEEARLELARLDFYEGQFDMALTRAQAMNRNTATDVANDAIALRLLLAENRGPDSLSTPLRAYARAELFHRQGRPADALAVADSLLGAAPEHGLADEATFLRATALRALGRPAEALAVLEAFPERFPDSYLADRALFAAAEVHERDLRDVPAAAAAYTAFLARFPGSLLAPEARARARRLRGDLPG